MRVKEICSPCVVQEVLGLTYRVCKKTDNKDKCQEIYNTLRNKKNVSVAEVKKMINDVKELTERKMIKDALDDVKDYLNNPN